LPSKKSEVISSSPYIPLHNSFLSSLRILLFLTGHQIARAIQYSFACGDYHLAILLSQIKKVDENVGKENADVINRLDDREDIEDNDDDGESNDDVDEDEEEEEYSHKEDSRTMNPSHTLSGFLQCQLKDWLKEVPSSSFLRLYDDNYASRGRGQDFFLKGLPGGSEGVEEGVRNTGNDLGFFSSPSSSFSFTSKSSHVNDLSKDNQIEGFSSSSFFSSLVISPSLLCIYQLLAQV
jgi:hypothetical protein